MNSMWMSYLFLWGLLQQQCQALALVSPLLLVSSSIVPSKRSSSRWLPFLPGNRRSTTTITTTLAAHHSLTSCLEHLDPELSWWDPTDPDDNQKCLTEVDTIISSDDLTLSVPLYPLPAVYLPGSEQYQLNNVEPRNIQMMLDIMQQNNNNNNNNPYICVVLRAMDTGRLARVGTLMKVVDFQVEELPSTTTTSTNNNATTATDDDIIIFPRRIVVQCVAEDLVDILTVENPDSLRFEYRLRQPREYATAVVQRRRSTQTTGEEAEDSTSTIEQENGKSQLGLEQLQEQAAQEYQAVREYYVQNDQIPCQEDFLLLPSNWTQGLPHLTSQNFSSFQFWSSATLWQSLCHTIQAGHQCLLATNRNELLVSAALKKGGPLKLPVHLEDVGPEDRQAVRDLEDQAQDEWLQTGLDPILDFQYLLECCEEKKRLEYLVHLMARERQRLEDETEKQMQQEALPYQEIMAAAAEPPKGAWFNDDAWQ